MNDIALSGGTENASLMSLFSPPTDIQKRPRVQSSAMHLLFESQSEPMRLVRRLKDSYAGCLDNTDS